MGLRSFSRKPGIEVALEPEAPLRTTFSVLVVSIPKSGTVYMNAMFRDGLELQNYTLSNRYFPEDQIYLDAMSEFQRGGYIASAHIDASQSNLQILAAFVPKWVVHFRDPRSVLLSWVHHVERLCQDGRFTDLLRVTPVPPRDLHAWSFEHRVDWHIEHFMPAVIEWMTAWLAAAEQMPDRILVTEFSALKETDADLLLKMLGFLGIDPTKYQHRPPVKTIASHFRTGTYDEWRQVFTTEQVEKASAMIPEGMKSRFGWPL
jgi:hypothetical protein